MKKNVMMRLASFLLVAVLISTSAISGTYAKYVTADSGKDEARVAKWGVELQVIGNLFGDSYDDAIVAQDDENLAVQSVDKATDVVAPGTKNEEGFTFSLKGQPEVDGIVEIDINTMHIFLEAGTWGVMLPVDGDIITEINFGELSDDLYTLNGTTYTKATVFAADTTYYTLEDEVTVNKTYCPMIFSATGTHTNLTGTRTTNTMQNLIYGTIGSSGAHLDITEGYPSKNMATGITTFKYTKAFDTNDDLAEVVKLDDMNITWEWPFEQEMDGADTILGMLKHTTDDGAVVKVGTDGNYTSSLTEYKDYCVDVMFDITITATQVD